MINFLEFSKDGRGVFLESQRYTLFDLLCRESER
jgi:hypothetical protein